MKKYMAPLSCFIISVVMTSHILFAGIDTGLGAGLVSSPGATINFVDSATLTNCLLKSTGGAFSGAATSTNSALVLPPTSGSEYCYATTDGTISFTSSTLALGNNQMLNMNGGSLGLTITVNGAAATPSIIEGAGQIQHAITVSDNCQLNMRWQGVLDANVLLSSSGHTTSLVLENDLHFSPGYCVTSSSDEGSYNTIDFSQGYAIYMGGLTTTPLSIAQSQTWTGPTVHLTGPVSLAASKTIALGGVSNGALYGHGHIFSFGTSSAFSTGASQNLLFEDITLENVQASSFSLFTGSYVYLKNVSWIDSLNNGIRVNPSPASSSLSPAQLTLATTNAGNIFGTDVTWNNGALIEFLSDVTLSGTWTFADNTVIEGHGCALTLSSGAFKILNGKTLKLRNIRLAGVVSGSLLDYDATHGGTLDLSGVTLMLNGVNVDWSSLYTSVVVSGPTTMVTGQNILSGPNVHGSASVSGVTLFYDTKGYCDNQNVQNFATSNGGQILQQTSVINSVSYVDASDALTHYEFLSPANGTLLGRQLVFNSETTTTLNGDGCGIIFPHTTTALASQVCVSIAESTHVITQNILLEGYKPAHVTIAGSDDTLGSLSFGNGTQLRLHNDLTGVDALAQTLQFGSSGEATSEVMLLDFNGATIDMASASAAIALQAGESSGSTLKLKNGRLINLSGTKLSAPAGATIILENMIVELSGTYTFASAALEISGSCEVRGVSGAAFTYTSTASLTIDTDGHLRFADGITYSHNNEGTTNFVLTDGTSSVELIGATFLGSGSAESALQLTKGVLLADHNAAINPSTAGIQIGDGSSSSNDLTVRVRPAATVSVSGGTLTYNNHGG